MKIIDSSRVILLTIFTNLFIVSGCDDRTIDPFEDRVEVFSIYGALDLANTTNVIRVKRATTYLLQDSADIQPFEVTFTDLQNNSTIELDPEIINFNGNYTFNFPIDYPIQSDSRYQVVMTDSEGLQSVATARTPGVVTPSVDTLGINNFGPLFFDNTECTTEHEFIFSNVKEGEQIFMFSGVKHNGQLKWARTRTVDRPTRLANTDSLTALLSVRHLLFDHFPLNDERYVHVDPRFWPATVDCDELDSNEILIRYFHFSPDWEAINGEDISTDFLFESGVVENGIGFFGGMYTGEYSYHFLLR
jgi:hypothetical protein